MPSEFDSSGVVAGYEDWLATPFGKLAMRLETELLLELLGEPRGEPREESRRDGELVLEIGCGTGLFASAVAQSGARVVGLDRSREMLQIARGRARVVQGDAARLPFRDGAFERVFMVAVLDFVDDPVAVLREARRVARDRVVVLALAGGSWIAWRRRIQGRLGHPIFRIANFYSRRRILRFARAAGAEPEHLRGILVLPPALAARWPRLEERLSRGFSASAAIVGFRMNGGSVRRVRPT